MSTGAVLTGDIIGSTKRSKTFLEKVKAVLAGIDDSLAGGERQFEIYRGDSFQLILDDAALSFRTAVLIRAGLQSEAAFAGFPEALDARIAIGIGELGEKTMSPGERNTEAFVLSGRLLDRLEDEKTHMAAVMNAGKNSDDLGLVTRWADDIISDWSPVSADTLYLYWARDLNQSAIAAELGISQPAAHKRFQQAKIDHLDFCERHFRKIVSTTA